MGGVDGWGCSKQERQVMLVRIVKKERKKKSNHPLEQPVTRFTPVSLVGELLKSTF